MTNPQSGLSGPRLDPPPGRPARQLVVLLHGFGADGSDLMQLAQAWRQVLPDAAFVAPDAPMRHPQLATGRQWFALDGLTGDDLARGTAAAWAPLSRLIAAERDRLGLAPSAVAVTGFSQGAMLALRAVTDAPGSFACAISYAGVVSWPVPPNPARPPVLLVHGAADTVIPAGAISHAQKALSAASFPVETMLRPGVAHGIDPQGIARGGLFLRRAFGVS